MDEQNDIKIFEFEHQNIETIFLDGEILFNPIHVGNILGLSEGSIRAYISDMDEEERVKIRDIGLNEKFNFKLKKGDIGFWIKEAGLYQLIFKSKKPEAQRFVKWITHDLLPQLRKTGSYHMSRDGQILAEIISNAENLLGIRKREIAINQNESWNMKLAKVIWDLSKNGMGSTSDLYDELVYLFAEKTGFDINKLARAMGMTRQKYLIKNQEICKTLYEFAIEHFYSNSRQVILLPADQTRLEV